MPASGCSSSRFRPVLIVGGLVAALAVVAAPAVLAQEADRIRPVTDAELANPSPDEWLMWRRTLDGWGYSPLDQIDRGNVADLRLVWSRALTPGRQQGTPLVRGGVLFMPNPRDIIQALDAVSGDLIWEHRRDRPDDLGDYMIGTLIDTNRNIAIHGELIIDTSMDDHIFALDAETGDVVWDTEILDYRVNPANQTSGPIVAGGKVFSGRSCDPRGGPLGCVITAHDAATGEELWRTRLIPAPGEPGDETWGDVPFEERDACRLLDGAQLRPRAEPGLRRHVGHLAGAEVHARRHGPDAPLPQLDARARRRQRRDRLALPAHERPLGPRPSVRAPAGGHRRAAGPVRRELDQPAAARGRGAPGGDRDSRQDRHRLHARPRDRRVPVGHADHRPERGQRHRRGHRRR